MGSGNRSAACRPGRVLLALWPTRRRRGPLRRARHGRRVGRTESTTDRGISGVRDEFRDQSGNQTCQKKEQHHPRQPCNVAQTVAIDDIAHPGQHDNMEQVTLIAALAQPAHEAAGPTSEPAWRAVVLSCTEANETAAVPTAIIEKPNTSWLSMPRKKTSASHVPASKRVVRARMPGPCGARGRRRPPGSACVAPRHHDRCASRVRFMTAAPCSTRPAIGAATSDGSRSVIHTTRHRSDPSARTWMDAL
jgi:hypothetical protein